MVDPLAAIRALGHLQPGTGPETKPSYLFGQPNEAWGANDFLIYEEDGGTLFWVNGDSEFPSAIDPLADPDQFVRDYFWANRIADMTISVLGGVETGSFSSAGPENVSIASKVVYFPYGNMCWCVATLMEMNWEVEVVPDGETDPIVVPMSLITLHPIVYPFSPAGTFSWLELVAGTRDYTIEVLPRPDVPGVPPATTPGPCELAHNQRVIAANEFYQGKLSGCKTTSWLAGVGGLAVTVSCCALGGTTTLPVAPLGCAIGAKICGAIVVGFLGNAYSECRAGAAHEYRGKLAEAMAALIDCCNEGSTEPRCDQLMP